MSSFLAYDDIQNVNNATQQQGNTSFKSFQPYEENKPTFIGSEKEPEPEGWGSYLARTAYQIPAGIAHGATYFMDLLAMMGAGESLDPEEIEQIRKVSERVGIPFDEEAYLQAVQQASETFPTFSNIERGVQDLTGIQLQPTDTAQKSLRFISTAGKLIPGKGITDAGQAFTRNVPTRAALGSALEVGKQTLIAKGVPEEQAEQLSFLMLGKPQPGQAGRNISLPTIGKKKKPSGLTERRFESKTTPTRVSESRKAKINDALEKDFKNISTNLIEESPVGETSAALKEDAAYKQKVAKQFERVNELAAEIPDKFNTQEIRTEIENKLAKEKGTGITASEYEKSYKKHMLEYLEDTELKNASAVDLVKQYRKNNQALGEIYEAGQSKAYNRGKKAALLDYNQIIYDQFEKRFPNSEFANLFKEQNKKWTAIHDLEVVNGFIDDLFDGNINYKKGESFFKKYGIQENFKRAFGENFPKFEQLLDDLLSTKRANALIKTARSRGFGELALQAARFLYKPWLIPVEVGAKGLKHLYQSLLDKPRLTLVWDKAVQDMKAGRFEQAQKGFTTLDKELKTVKPDEIKSPISKKKALKETIEVKGEKVETPKNENKQLDNQRKLIEKKDKKQLDVKQSKKVERINRFNKEYHERKKSNEPILLPYTPKKTPAKVAIDKIINGSKISEGIKKDLKDVRVSLYSTRGKGEQFHGSRNKINKLNPEIHDVSGEQNIYGAGFYTTDALDVAEGYSKAKKAKQPTIYQVKEKKPQNLYDAEKPIDEFKKLWIDKKGKNESNIMTDVLLNEKPKNLREYYDRLSEVFVNEGIPAYEAQAYFSEIQNLLEDKGYDGISHKGGLLTNTPSHQVKIYWKPENLEIEQISVPKSTKKVKKTIQEKIPNQEIIDSKAGAIKKELVNEKIPNDRIEHIKQIRLQKENLKGKKGNERKDLLENIERSENRLFRLNAENLKTFIEKPEFQKNTKPATLTTQKDFILASLEDALKNPKDVDQIIVQVPGDGVFRFNNIESVLQDAIKKVKKDWPVKPLKNEPPSYGKSPSQIKKKI